MKIEFNVKAETIGYVLLGICVVWYLIGSGRAKKYSENILTMAKLYPAPPTR